MDLERLQRVLVVGGHEDHHRHLLGTDLPDHAEAIDGGHLHVEEHELGRELLDRVDGLHAVGALPHDLDVGFLREQPAIRSRAIGSSSTTSVRILVTRHP